MSDDQKSKSKSIGGVGKAKGVKAADEVGEVQQVEKAAGISGVGKIDKDRVRQATRMMSAAERDTFFQMIEEEAEKLFGGTGLSEEKKTIIKDSVKMAIDASIVDED